jgi:hypothetical protein
LLRGINLFEYAILRQVAGKPIVEAISILDDHRIDIEQFQPDGEGSAALLRSDWGVTDARFREFDFSIILNPFAEQPIRNSP